MRPSMRRYFQPGRAALLTLVVAIAGCDASEPKSQEPVTVEQAYVRLPAVPGRPGAAYFMLRSNHGMHRLDGIASAQAERIELHESREHGGMSHMAPLAAPDIAEGATLAFEPGGKHAMLFGIDPSVKPGGTIRLQFTLTPNRRIETDAKVLSASDPIPTKGP